MRWPLGQAGPCRKRPHSSSAHSGEPRAGWGGAYHKGEALGRQGPEAGGAVPHAHLHQGIMGPHSAGVTDLTHDPAGSQGGSVSSGASGLQGPPAHAGGTHCSALIYSLSMGLHSTLPTRTPSCTSSKRRPRFSPMMVSRVPPCRGPVSGDSCGEAEAQAGEGHPGPGGAAHGGSWAVRATPNPGGPGGPSTLRILGSAQRLPPWRACIQAAGESSGQWGRREQRRSATHQPHSNRGSALRQRPQLSRRAGHL